MMSWYRFRKYLHYCNIAKDRHDIHSPFVFDLIENGIRRPDKISFLEAKDWEALSPGSFALLQKLLAHYRWEKLLLISPSGRLHAFNINYDQETTDTLAISNQDTLASGWDLVLLDASQATSFPWEQYTQENTVVLLYSPYQSSKAHSALKETIAGTNVRLSLDLFHIALLYFSGNFMIKQHFVLKNR